MLRKTLRAAGTLVLAAATGLLLPTLVALADESIPGGELKGATAIWITCGVFVILGGLGLFWAWRDGQFGGDVEDSKYRMLDVEDENDLQYTLWRATPKKRRVRRSGTQSAKTIDTSI